MVELDPSSLQVSRSRWEGSSSRLAAVIFLLFIQSPPHHSPLLSTRLDSAVEAWRSIYTGTQLELIRRRQSSPPVVFDVIHDSSHENYEDDHDGDDEDEDVGDNSLPNSDSNFQAAFHQIPLRG